MLCEVCGKNNATTHIKTVINGELTEYHLCRDCAKEKGYAGTFGNFGFGISDLIGGFFAEGRSNAEEKRCGKCGQSFRDITRTGKIGCAECYRTFRDELTSMIQRIHGTTIHKGKRPGSSGLRVTNPNKEMMAVKLNPLEEKRRLLKQAVDMQEFERAAVLRDEIKELEADGK